ncbi:MAG: GDP-mannose 4,6-dehydratase, partial [Gammaproteobacteria bacterium]
MNILITGAAGFIGSTLAHGLPTRRDSVIGIDNLNTYYDPRLKEARLARLKKHADFVFKRLDIVDRERMAELFKRHRFDAVCTLPP